MDFGYVAIATFDIHVSSGVSLQRRLTYTHALYVHKAQCSNVDQSARGLFIIYLKFMSITILGVIRYPFSTCKATLALTKGLYRALYKRSVDCGLWAVDCGLGCGL